MSYTRDSSSLGPVSSQSMSGSDIVLNSQRLSELTNTTLYELDDYEAISMVFLLLDTEHLAGQGFKYCQHICNGRQKEVMDILVNAVRHLRGSMSGSLSAVMEALYLIGRYDLLEDNLNIAVNHEFQNVFNGNIDDDRKRLYLVFAGMAQTEADRIIHARLNNWYCPEPDRPLEETFARNLQVGNYYALIASLYEALMNEEQETLAAYLRPLVREPAPEQPPQPSPQSPSLDNENTYKLPTRYPHGLCVIINVRSFMKPRNISDTFPLDDRHGSDIDKERLAGTFKLFGFCVMHLDNPDHERLSNFFRGLRTNPKIGIAACLVVCIMTHGDEQDQIYLHDRSCVSMTEFRKLCFSEVLVGTPRLYFVQACRGERPLNPIFLQRDSCTVTHAESDCLISAATIEGYSAVRSQSDGSWYITDLCQSLQEYGHHYPIKTVLQKTRNKLKERVGCMNNSFVTQLSEDKDTLLKDVQFKRADEEHFIDGILDLVRLEVLELLVEDTLEEAANSWLSREGQQAGASSIADVTDRLSNVQLT